MGIVHPGRVASLFPKCDCRPDRPCNWTSERALVAVAPSFDDTESAAHHRSSILMTRVPGDKGSRPACWRALIQSVARQLNTHSNTSAFYSPSRPANRQFALVGSTEVIFLHKECLRRIWLGYRYERQLAHRSGENRIFEPSLTN